MYQFNVFVAALSPQSEIWDKIEIILERYQIACANIYSYSRKFRFFSLTWSNSFFKTLIISNSISEVSSKKKIKKKKVGHTKKEKKVWNQLDKIRDLSLAQDGGECDVNLEIICELIACNESFWACSRVWILICFTIHFNH